MGTKQQKNASLVAVAEKRDEETWCFDDVLVPRRVAALAGRIVVAVACGDFHTLAVVDSNEASVSHSLFAWGDNMCGQLGLGDFRPRSRPTEIPLDGLGVQTVPSLAAGAAHTAAVFDLKAEGPTRARWDPPP